MLDLQLGTVFLTFLKTKFKLTFTFSFRQQLKHLYFSHYEHTECIRGYLTVNAVYKLLNSSRCLVLSVGMLPVMLFQYVHLYDLF